MIRKLIAWALDNPIVVILLAVFLAVIGVYSFLNINVEAYPDPAPAIVEVIALFPGASAEEVERQVTIPLEVTFSGMPGLKTINSKSLFGLSDLKMNWHYGSDVHLLYGSAGSYQPHGHDCPAAAAQRDPRHLAGVPHGRNLPLCPEFPQGCCRQRALHAQRPQGVAGLGAGARVPEGAAGRGHHQLRRYGAAVRGPARPRSPPPLRHHAAPAPGDADQRQRHGGWRLHHPGPDCHDGAECRPVWRRPGPGEQGAGPEEPRRGRLHPPL